MLGWLNKFKFFRPSGIRYHVEPDGSKHPATFRLSIGRLRFHIFFRNDDVDYHTHKREFWTFPLVGYVEELLLPDANGRLTREINYVPAFRVTNKPPHIPHRVLHAIKPNRKIVTILWWDSKEIENYFYVEKHDGDFAKVPASDFYTKQYDSLWIEGVKSGTVHYYS